MPDGAQPVVKRIFFAAIVLVAGIVSLSVWLAQGLYDAHAQRIATSERLVSLQRLASEVLAAEANQRAYLLTDDPVFLGNTARHADQARRLAALLATAEWSSGVIEQDVLEITETVDVRLATLDALTDRYNTGGLEGAEPLIGERRGTLAAARFADAHAHLTEHETEYLHGLRERVALGGQMLFLLLGFGALLNVALLGVLYHLQRSELAVTRRLLGELKRRGGEVACLNEMSAALLSCTTTAEANQVVRHYLKLLLPATAGALYVLRASRNQYDLQERWGEPAGELADPVHADECWALRRGDTHLMGASSDLRCTHVDGEAGVASCCVPMMALGETVGLLHVQCAPHATFDQDTRRLIETAASQIASALASLSLRAALHTQSIKDPLTDLYNRRYLEETMKREEQRAVRDGAPIGLIMIDLDHFKRFNDEYGHHAGDLVLKLLTEQMTRSIRGEDIACRYGGEEFLLVLPGATLERTLARAESLRAAVEALEAEVGGRTLPKITASFGVAVFPDHGEDWTRVQQRADAALYQAKRDGRNRVAAAG